MNVLHVIVGLDSGGAERMLQRLVEVDLAKPSCSHTVVSLTNAGAVGLELRGRGVPVTALGLRSVLGLPRALWQLMHLVRAVKPDIVQTWMYHADFLGGLAARMAGYPVVWCVRTTDIPAGTAPVTAALRWACARLSSRIPNVIVCAAQASRAAHADIGYDNGKMVVVPNGYDFSRLAASEDERLAWRAEQGVGENEIVVGSMGRMHADKDPENFVRMAAILGQSDTRLRFLMVGRGLDEASVPLRRWIAASGLAHRFILAGERADVPQCLAAMDVFCLHSRNEGFPNVLAEAMAMGLPCVTTDVGDAALLLGDADYVVPKGDPAALARVIDRLLRLEPANRRAIGARAKAHAQSEYSIGRAREGFDAVYRQVLLAARR